MKTIEVKFTRLHPDAVIPSYAHGPDEDAGLDLRAVEAATLHLGSVLVVKTGLAVELPAGVEMQIRPRSGLAAKHGVTVLNSPGTIDPSYRGEVAVILTKLAGPGPLEIKVGDRIAQAVFSEYVAVKAKEARTLSVSKRGTGGLGSTGVA